MSGFSIVPFGQEHASRWDELVDRSPVATFLHSRRFLSYHGSRFQDQSLLIEDEQKGLAGVFPAAVSPSDAECIVSHPGITYGGIVHQGELHGERMIATMSKMLEHYRRLGFRKLRYKVVPHIYHERPCGDDLYALFRLGARRYRCDLSATIDTDHRPTPKERRRRGIKRAEKAGVTIKSGINLIEPFWHILEANLSQKHESAPVHTIAEIAHLHELFPENIELVAGIHQERVVAGVVMFHSNMVTHAQYIASTDQGNKISALDAVFEWCIRTAGERGKRYFDFGISNENEGQSLNEGLYQFKREFGAGGVPYEFYEIDL